MATRPDVSTPLEVTGAIIAGGAGRRMGADKRTLLVDGTPLLMRVASAMTAVSDELVIACRSDSPPAPDLWQPFAARLVFDRLEDAGPLAGVEAALAAAAGEFVLVVAGDMPWLVPDVLRLLIGEAQRQPEAVAVALRTARGPEPLLCVYHRRVLPTVTRLLDRGERRMHALLAAIPVREIAPDIWRVADPSGRTAVNLNVPTDLMTPDSCP